MDRVRPPAPYGFRTSPTEDSYPPSGSRFLSSDDIGIEPGMDGVYHPPPWQ